MRRIFAKSARFRVYRAMERRGVLPPVGSELVLLFFFFFFYFSSFPFFLFFEKENLHLYPGNLIHW